MKRIVCLLLLCALLLSGCGKKTAPAATGATDTSTTDVPTTEAPPLTELRHTGFSGSKNLMENVMASAVSPLAADETFAKASLGFSAELLKHTYQSGKTLVISPYSILTALAMTANGAGGETLAQFESAFGMPVAELNRYLYTLEKNAGEELVSANSLWFSDMADFVVKQDFLQRNADYYGAETYQSAFDAQAVERINAWVKEHTKERIERIVEDLNPLARMVLINALTFDAKWAEPYEENFTRDGTFHAADGSTQKATMLYSEENTYLDDGKATGFVKPYSGGRYSFFALLPKEGVSMDDYVSTLSGEGLYQTIVNASDEPVHAAMPALKVETDLHLKEALEAMGLTDAFSMTRADFSGISDTPLYVDEVLHKTYFSLDNEGTQAAAVTAVIVVCTSAVMPEPKEVIIDRPYVMGILDNESKEILFFGVINRLE